MDQFLSIIFFDSRLGAPRRPLPRLPEREYRAPSAHSQVPGGPAVTGRSGGASSSDTPRNAAR